MASHGHSTVEMVNPAHAAHGAEPAKEDSGHKVDHAAEFTAFVAKCDKENGLSEARAAELLIEFGPNALDEKKRSKILLFLSFLSPLNPMPCAIWIAVFIELAMAITTGEAWVDFAVLLALQFANAIVGFIEESNAGDAIDALKKNLAPQANVIRGGEHRKLAARELVPGDLIEMKLGDIIPADAILLDGKPVQIDQAALTGESLPVTLGPGQHVKMSSAMKQGHIKAIVVATGKNTFIGKAAGMMASVQHKSNLHKILTKITVALLVICVIACACIFARVMTAPDPEGAVWDGAGDSTVLRSLGVVIVILVASIPVAIEVVVTSTMAVGSHVMARKKVIVARLSAIEELAGMTVLCSDKTGTLTLNQLSLRDPILLNAKSAEELTFYAALASKRDGDLDAIDLCITSNLTEAQKVEIKGFVEEDFHPFDPISKRTLAIVRRPDGTRFQVSKGAPQVSLRMCWNAAEIKDQVTRDVDALAARGFRSLGVAISRVDPSLGEKAAKWEFLGVLSLFDPPRPDSKETIAAAIANGVEVKMITGDHGKIAKETCKELGMGSNILNTEILDDKNIPVETIQRIIMEAHGFAEVMPEHKFAIVQHIRELGHITGMTGDGVNDAPALKRADIGIAVHGATDAARAAAAIVLTEPGISVIIDAVYESRKIFQRMRNYLIYRISCTMQLLFFFFFAILCMNVDSSYFYNGQYFMPGTNPPATTYYTVHAPFFSLPVISLVIITILNDGAMITTAGDVVYPEQKPQTWNMTKIWLIAIVLGGVACFSSLILVAECMNANYFNPGTIVGTLWGSYGNNYLSWYETKTIIYLKVSISDFLTLFSARTTGWFWERRLSTPLLIAFFIATGASTILSLIWAEIFGLTGSNAMASLYHSKGAVVCTWVYCILWWFVQDAAKVGAYKLIEKYLTSPEEKARAQHATMRQPEHLPSARNNAEAVKQAADAITKETLERQAKAREEAIAKEHAAPSNAAVEAVMSTLGRAANAIGEQGTFGRVAGNDSLAGRGPSTRAGTVGTGTVVQDSNGRAVKLSLEVSKALVPNDVDLNAVVATVRENLRTANGGHAAGGKKTLASIFANNNNGGHHGGVPSMPSPVIEESVSLRKDAIAANLTDVSVHVAVVPEETPKEEEKEEKDETTTGAAATTTTPTTSSATAPQENV